MKEMLLILIFIVMLLISIRLETIIEKMDNIEKRLTPYEQVIEKGELG